MGAIAIFSKEPSSNDDSLFTNGRLSREEITSLQKQFPLFTELAKFIAMSINAKLGPNADASMKVEN